MTRARPLLLAILVGALVFVAFAPALGAQWLLWDDDRAFLAHDAWRGLTPKHLGWMATTFHMGPYQPLAWLSLGVDHALWGMDASGYHLTNVVLHALTAVGLFFFARALLARFAGGASAAVDLGAAFAAAAFACHPLRVESVAWITERRDVLSGLFLVLFASAWLRWIERGSRAAYGLALALYAASLASKGLGMTVPFVLIALDATLFGRLDRKAWEEKWPLFALAAVAALLAWHGQATLGPTMVTLQQHGVVQRLAVAAYGLAFYLYKQLLPLDLVPLESLQLPLDAGALRFVASAVAVAAAAALAVRFRKRSPGLAAAGAAHVLFLLPVIGLTQTGPQLVADRYSYLPSLGWALLAGWLVARFAQRYSSVAGLAAAVLLAPLVVLTNVQASHWRDTRSLFQYALERRPEDLVVRRNVVAALLADARRPGEAGARKASYAEALRLCGETAQRTDDPFFALNASDAHRGLAELEPERRDEHLQAALALVDQALAAAARRPELLATKGRLLMAQGHAAEAVQVFEELVRVDSANGSAHRYLADALLAAGRPADAIAKYRELAKAAPNVARVWIGLGKAHAALGQNDAARAAFQNAVQLLERDPAAAAELASTRATLEALR